MEATLPPAPDVTIAELVLEDPRRGALLSALGLDYCCQGASSLAAACERHGLDPRTIVAVLEAQRSVGRRQADERDWRRASTPELIEHIVSAHHDWLRRRLPLVAETIAAVVRVHAAEDPRLNDLARVHHALSTELLDHAEREEEVLFPACLAIDGGEVPADVESLLVELEDDHAGVGRQLVVLRELAGDFREETALCATHARLLADLRNLERDVHEHVHEENNILFPRIRTVLAGSAR